MSLLTVASRDPAFHHFVAVTSYFDLSVSPDGATAALISNAHGSKQLSLHSFDPLRPDGQERLLRAPDADLMPDRVVWSRDGRFLIVAADCAGNEQFGLYRVDVTDGRWLRLTREDARHELAPRPWSPDGRRLAFASNARCDADLDVCVLDVDSGATRTLVASGDWLMPWSWSPDGRHILATRFHLSTEQDLLLIDAETGATRELTRREIPATFTPGPWSADGSGFLVLSDHGREFVGIARIDVATASLAWLRTPDHDVEAIGASSDGTRIAWLENEHGWSTLHTMHGESWRVEHATRLGRGVVWSRWGVLPICDQRAEVAFYFSTPTTPWHLRRLDLSEPESPPVHVVPRAGVEARGVEPEMVSFASSDDVAIEALLYRPVRPRTGGRAPCVLAIHGGPEAQERPWYACGGLYQYLAHRGIGVLTPNVRGSTGRGRSFQRRIYRDFGGVDLVDFEAALRFLLALDWVDPLRIGVFGASYGGFATLSCISRIAHPWAAAVGLVAPTDLVSLASEVPPWWRRVMPRWMGDPVDDAVLLRERSPFSHRDAIRAPLLLIHGSNDPRVGHRRSQEIVEHLRSKGRTAAYLGFTDEGHAFGKAANLHRVLAASAEWFQSHLGGSGDA